MAVRKKTKKTKKPKTGKKKAGAKLGAKSKEASVKYRAYKKANPGGTKKWDTFKKEAWGKK